MFQVEYNKSYKVLIRSKLIRTAENLCSLITFSLLLIWTPH